MAPPSTSHRGFVLKGPDLDALAARHGALLGPGERGVEISRRNDPEAPDVFLGLGEWSIRHQELAAVGLDHRGRAGGKKPAAEHPGPVDCISSLSRAVCS